MTTPGRLRQFAAKARSEAQDYRHWAHAASDPASKRRYERYADDRDDHADWYLLSAQRGEIEAEYTTIEFHEAAE